MEESPVQYHAEDIDFSLSDEAQNRKWILSLAEKHNRSIGFINYIFCSDSYLHSINVSYLNHDTLTDIITFPYREDDILESDIFISVDRVKENCRIHKSDFSTELLRVMSHGVLHLCGYKDKTKEEAQTMRRLEEEAISLFERSTSS